MKLSLSTIVVLVVALFATVLGGAWLFNRLGTPKITSPATQPNLITTTILPLNYFADRLTAGLESEFTVVNIVPSGYSPESYEPTPQQVVQLAQSAVLFQIGLLPVETTQLKTLAASQPQLKVVNVDPGTELLVLEDHGHEEENHQEEVSASDPHTWLDPVRARAMVGIMKQELQQFAPTESAKVTLDQNWQKLDAELAQLDAMLTTQLSPLKNTQVMVYHPELAYLARRYGFSQLAIEIEGKEPSLAEIKTIIEQAKLNNIKTIFVQPQYSSQAAQAIAQEIEGVVVSIDPLAYDYFATIQSIAAALQASAE
jgi:zinc transport system substrate-binding protein